MSIFIYMIFGLRKFVITVVEKKIVTNLTKYLVKFSGLLRIDIGAVAFLNNIITKKRKEKKYASSQMLEKC